MSAFIKPCCVADVGLCFELPESGSQRQQLDASDLLGELTAADAGPSDPLFSYGYAPQAPVSGQRLGPLTPLSYNSSCIDSSASTGWCIVSEWCVIATYPSPSARLLHGSTLANCGTTNRYCAPAVTFNTRGGTCDYAEIVLAQTPPSPSGNMDSIILYVYADGFQALQMITPSAGVLNVTFPGGAKQNVTILSDPKASCFGDGIYLTAKYYGSLAPSPSPSTGTSPSASASTSGSPSRAASSSATASSSASASLTPSTSASPLLQGTILAELTAADLGPNDPYFSYGYAPQVPVAGQRLGPLTPLSYNSSCITTTNGWCVPNEWCLVATYPSPYARIMHGSSATNCSSLGRYCAPALRSHSTHAAAGAISLRSTL